MEKRLLRIVSMLIDHISMALIVMPVLGLFVGILFLIGYYFEGVLNSGPNFYGFILLPYMIYFLKDSFKGKSIGKRALGFKVVNRSSGETANALHCFVRNLTIPIWPLEVFISLFSPQIRLGDLLANTKVIPAEKEPVKNLWTDIKASRFSKQTIFIVLIGLAYSYLLGNLFVFLINGGIR